VVLFGAANALRAQTDQPALRLSGFGGLGFGRTSIHSGDLWDSRYRDLSSEFGLSGSGFLYDPRFANYTLSTIWDGNNTAIDQGSARSNGLNFNGSLNFLPQRSFPFGFYFSRSRSDASGSLLPALTNSTSLWGFRGELKQPKLAHFTYNLGAGKSENDVVGGAVFYTRHRFANLNATRKLFGWDVRVGNNYLKTISSFANFLDRNNTLSADASRSFNERVRAGFGASRSTFEFRDLAGDNQADSAVTLVYGNLNWAHTDKLESFYSFNATENAVNTLRIASRASGDSLGRLPFNDLSLDSSSQTLSSGLNYRPVENLSLNANLNYSHNGLPEASLGALSEDARRVLATDVLNAGVAGSYLRRVGGFNWHSGAGLDWQRFSLLAGEPDSGLGYRLDQGLSGGDVRRLRYSFGYRYNRRSNPIFFNVVTTRDHRGTLKLDSHYFGFVLLQGLAEIGTTKLDLAGSAIDLDTSNYMLSATFPARRLSVFASRGVSSSGERLFNPDSILFQPGGSTGSVPLPGSLLNPLVYSDVMSRRVGLNWRVRPNLQIESRYSANQYVFLFLNSTENRYRQFDTTVQYKFGRFTMALGYGRASGQAARFEQQVNRLFFRVRFPFHIL
jgi:hypothetical protein